MRITVAALLAPAGGGGIALLTALAAAPQAMFRGSPDHSGRYPVREVTHFAAAETVRFRRYLDAGGDVVWPGIPSLIRPRDPRTGEGSECNTIDPAGVSEVLALDDNGRRRYGGTAERR